MGAIENPQEDVLLISPEEKICAYAMIMGVFFVPALIWGKAQSWLLCNIAEFLMYQLQFTMGNFNFTLGLNYHGLQWEHTEEDSLQAVDSIAPESAPGEIIVN